MFSEAVLLCGVLRDHWAGQCDGVPLIWSNSIEANAKVNTPVKQKTRISLLFCSSPYCSCSEIENWALFRASKLPSIKLISDCVALNSPGAAKLSLFTGCSTQTPIDSLWIAHFPNGRIITYRYDKYLKTIASLHYSLIYNNLLINLFTPDTDKLHLLCLSHILRQYASIYRYGSSSIFAFDG